MRKSPDFKLIDSVKDNTGRLLLLKVEVFKTMFIIGNVYAPNNETDQVEFFDNVYSTLLDFNDEGHPCMIGGDFNLIQDLDLDREGGTMKQLISGHVRS